MQTGDRHKMKYFQDNIVIWKTLQDGISEQGFFSYSCNSTVFLHAHTGWRETYLLTRFRFYWNVNLIRHSFCLK